MSFSKFSCNYLSDVLSDDQVRKQSAMSKRGQKKTSNEGSPMAKTRKATSAIARSINLVMRSPRSEENSSQRLGSLVNPENTDGRKEVEIASRKLVRPDSNSEVGYSQASRRQENVPQASRKLVQEDQNQTESDERKYSNSNGTRKLAASSPELKNMEYTNHQYMSNKFQCFAEEVGNVRN